MTNDIYKTPESNIIQSDGVDGDFYIVSPTKFLILYISTMGLYNVYWFYKHWSQFKKSSGWDVWPVMRAIFSIFFAHSLFDQIEIKRTKVGTENQWTPTNMATLYVIFRICGNICNQLSIRGVGDPWTSLASIVSLPATCWTLYVAQRAANVACGDVHGESNNRLTFANYIWILIGLLLWLLSIVGLYAIFLGAE